MFRLNLYISVWLKKYVPPSWFSSETYVMFVYKWLEGSVMQVG